jgi:hypothetical protein
MIRQMTIGPISFRQVAFSRANERVPRGPNVGCHVAPHHLLVGKKLLEARRIEPVSSTWGNVFGVGWVPTRLR